jgi:hypothetical protein
MEGLLILVAVLLSAAATGVFLWAVWRFVFLPTQEGLPTARRAVVLLAMSTLVIAPLVLAQLDLSDLRAFLVIAIVTFLAIGIAIVASLPSRAFAAEDEDHT